MISKGLANILSIDFHINYGYVFLWYNILYYFRRGINMVGRIIIVIVAAFLFGQGFFLKEKSLSVEALNGIQSFSKKKRYVASRKIAFFVSGGLVLSGAIKYNLSQDGVIIIGHLIIYFILYMLDKFYFFKG